MTFTECHSEKGDRASMGKVIVKYNKRLCGLKGYEDYPRFQYIEQYGEESEISWSNYDEFACLSNNSVMIKFSYDGTEQIRYITAWIVVYNEAGETVPRKRSENNGDWLEGEPQLAHKVPIENHYRYFLGDLIKNELSYKYWRDIRKYEIKKVMLDFADGTCQEVKGEDIVYQPTEADGGGCYVATCVYGSYDCPEVWALRRYRDEYLSSHLLGRAFIKTYYAISPSFVKHFGHTRWFVGLFKRILDKKVKRLREKGVSDTPYNDRHHG